MLKKIFFILISLFSIKTYPVSLYNISPLFPLAKQNYEELPGLVNAGCPKNILSLETVKKLPLLFESKLTIEDYYKTHRLVSIRFAPGDAEVRLIFQPLLYDFNPFGHKKLSAVDASFHLFFKTSTEQVIRFVESLEKKFPALSKNLLGRHPSFNEASDVKKYLSSELCDIAKLELHKVTYMTVRQGGVMWHFGGYHVENNNGVLELAKPVEILNVDKQVIDPMINHQAQFVIKGSQQIKATVLPMPTKATNLSSSFKYGNSVLSFLKIKSTRRTVDAIENPEINTPETVDCISCHATESLRRKMETDYQVTSSKNLYNDLAGYSLDKSVDTKIMTRMNNFRSFGYFNFSPIVSRRVLNDSIQVQKVFFK